MVSVMQEGVNRWKLQRGVCNSFVFYLQKNHNEIKSNCKKIKSYEKFDKVFRLRFKVYKLLI